MKNAIILCALLACTHANAATLPFKNLLISPQKPLVPPSFVIFRGHESDQGYRLQWKFSSNSGVQSFIIESTYEDPYDVYSVWEVKGMINPKPGMNMFTDNQLLPGIINYRIIATGPGNAPISVSEIMTASVQ